jgi:hypothetical protein
MSGSIGRAFWGIGSPPVPHRFGNGSPKERKKEKKRKEKKRKKGSTASLALRLFRFSFLL